MAQIDLRHADILLLDGLALAGAVNQPGGYAIGVSTMLIDGMSTPIANGSTFTIAGQGSFTVSSTVGGSTPTSVTFTPPLSAPVSDNTQILFLLEAGAVNDGAGVAAGQGTVTVDGLAQAIPNGSLVVFDGHATVYTISSTVGGSTPTSISFTPVLTSSVADDETMTFSIKGAVNKPGTASPANGDTVLAVDGFSQAIPVNSRLTVTGSTRKYRIVSSVGGVTPTSITITPPLATADGLPVDNAVVTVGPRSLSLKIGEGNLTYEEKRNINYVREKKSIQNGFVMTGDDEPMDVSLDAVWEFLSSDDPDPPTLEEILTHTGAGTAWLTSGADKCEPHSLDMEILYAPPCEGVPGERILLRETRWETIGHDLKAATLSIKGKCKVLLAESSRELSPLTP